MIKYRENKNDIIQSVEIDLTKTTAQSRQDIESKINQIDTEDRSIFKFEAGNKLIYETEVLVPKVNKNRLNVLMVLGNPAVHSVVERMFFSYEKTRIKEKWREHRFWRALRDCGVLKFYRNVENPTPENIREINARKRAWLLNGEYESEFNIFILPYFSFPTPASGKCSGVAGIRRIVGEEIFKDMKEFEFQRFEGIVLSNDIKNVICFQETARKEIAEKAQGKPIDNILEKPVYELGDALKYVTLYTAGTTRLIHTNKGKDILEGILSDIETKK